MFMKQQGKVRGDTALKNSKQHLIAYPDDVYKYFY